MAVPSKPIRLPLQIPIFRKEHFASDDGVRYINQQMLQMVNAINSSRGEFGPATIPGGVDVQGASITGLGSPSGPTDAVSAGHASSNYGAPTVGPQLDLGGSNTLKGLAYVYGQVQSLSSNQQATYTGGESFTILGLTIKMGMSPFTGTPGSPIGVTFGAAFPSACNVVMLTSVQVAGQHSSLSSVVQGSVSTTGFEWENGTGSDTDGACPVFWLAMGS